MNGRTFILQGLLLRKSLRAAITHPHVFWFFEYEHLNQERCQNVLPGVLCSLPKTTLTPPLQVRVHPGRLHSHHRMRLPYRHPCCDSPQVCQPHLFHLVLPEPFHSVALAGYLVCLHWDPDVHRSVEQSREHKKPASEGQEKLRSVWSSESSVLTRQGLVKVWPPFHVR